MTIENPVQGVTVTLSPGDVARTDSVINLLMTSDSTAEFNITIR